MKRDHSGDDSSSLRQWKRMSIHVALKTDVIARYCRRSDAECRALVMGVKPVMP